MKILIKDAETDKQYEVTEIAEEEAKPEVKDDETSAEALTADEVVALKKLAVVADKLVEMLADKPAELDDADKKDEDEDKGCVVDTKSTKDSVRSVGSIEKKQVVDSVEEDDVSKAWAKRYGG